MKDAPTGQDRVRVTLVGRAELIRCSLQTDARILAGRGLSVRAIASQIGVSPATVSRWTR